MTEDGKRFDYKWVILITCSFMVFVSLGFCSSNKGLYLTAITEALDIKRSLFSINDSFRFATSAVINLFFGPLIGRFGARKMTAFGFFALILSMLSSAVAESVVLFYASGILLGIGLSFTSNAMAGYIIRRWFKKNIGRYTGIVFAANGIGGAVSAQIISPLINREGDPFGYRISYLVVAAILLVAGIVIVCLLREYPSTDTPHTAAVAKKKAAKDGWVGITLKDARRKPFLYLALINVFFTGFILQGIGNVYAAHLEDTGIDAVFIATLVSILSLVLTLSKLLVGAMYDKLGLAVSVSICQISAVIALVLMPFIAPTDAGRAISVISALLRTFALPLETLAIPLIVNDLFGAKQFDTFLGIFSAVNYAGYAIGSPLINLSYDLTGSYNTGFIICIGIMAVCLTLFLISYRGARKLRREIEASAV